MSKRDTVLHGVVAVGAVVAGADVDWGSTEQNGATLAIDGQDVDVMSGQSRILEDSFASARTITATFRLQKSDLLNVRDSLGLPATALTGDLYGATTPTAEVLTIDEAQIGTQENALFIESLGPKGPRRVDIPRAKNRGGITLEFAANDYIKLESTWTVLRPKEGSGPGGVGRAKPVTITDQL